MGGVKYLTHEDYDKLQAEIARLRTENKQLVNDHHKFYGAALIKIDKLRAALERASVRLHLSAFGHDNEIAADIDAALADEQDEGK